MSDDGKVVSGYLILESVSTEDAGQFVCIARNGPKVVKGTLELTVNGKSEGMLSMSSIQLPAGFQLGRFPVVSLRGANQFVVQTCKGNMFPKALMLVTIFCHWRLDLILGPVA